MTKSNHFSLFFSVCIQLTRLEDVPISKNLHWIEDYWKYYNGPITLFVQSSILPVKANAHGLQLRSTKN